MSILQAIGGLAGGALSSVFGNKAAKKQYKQQKEFAQNAIQWKVDDAKKAGVHPLAALGAQTTSYSPVSVGGADFTQSGQSLGRALDAHMDTTERTVSKLAVEKAALENDYLRAQIASIRGRINQAPIPARPSERDDNLIQGQGDTRAVTKITNPEELTHLNTPFGRMRVRPFTSNAQTYEDRYGDIIQEFGGLGNFVADLTHTGNVAIERNWPRFYQWFRSNYIK